MSERKSSRRRILRFGVGAALVGGALYWGIPIVKERATHVTEIDARIEADLITVSSRVSGWVVAVNVREGDMVAPGTVLVEIDRREATSLERQLRAQFEGIAAERKRMAAERELIDKQTQSRIGTALTQQARAKVAVTALRPQVRLARDELARSGRLFRKKIVSTRQHDQAKTTLTEIEGRYQVTVADLEAARAQVAEAEADRARLAVIEGEMAILEHREAEVWARLQQQELDVQDRSIQSPIQGITAKTFVEAGEYVEPGQRLVMVHDPGKIWVRANIKETEIRRLAVGQPVAIQVDAFPDQEFIGAVEIIGNAATSAFALLPSPNPSGNFTKITQRLPVRISIDPDGKPLRPGMLVEISVDVGDS